MIEARAAEIRLGFFFHFQTYAVHRLHRFDRILARRRFRRQHHRIGTVEHGIGHVRYFGPGRDRAGNHRLHHLCGGNHHFVPRQRHPDHAFLQCGHGCIADFHAQITPRDHDRVGRIENFLEVLDRLGTLDLGY